MSDKTCKHCDDTGIIEVEGVGIEHGCCQQPLESGECCGESVAVQVPEMQQQQCPCSGGGWGT